MLKTQTSNANMTPVKESSTEGTVSSSTSSSTANTTTTVTSFLCNGDFISLYAEGTRASGYISVESHASIKLNVFPGADSGNFHESCVFKITAESKDIEPGKVLRYGDTVLFTHIGTEKYLSRSSTDKKSHVDKTCTEVVLHSSIAQHHSHSVFKLVPRFKLHSEGEDVRYNDQILLEINKQLIHLSEHNVNGRHEINLGHGRDTGIRIKPFASYDVTKFQHYLKGGDYIRLFHTEDNGFLYCKTGSDTNSKACVSLRKLGEDTNFNDYRNANTIWHVEFIDTEKSGGRTFTWSDKCRLRHVLSGLFLTVNPPSGAYPDMHSLISATRLSGDNSHKTAVHEAVDSFTASKLFGLTASGEQAANIPVFVLRPLRGSSEGAITFSDYFYLFHPYSNSYLHVLDKANSSHVSKDFKSILASQVKQDQDAFHPVTVLPEDVRDFYFAQSQKKNLEGFLSEKSLLSAQPNSHLVAQVKRAFYELIRFCVDDDTTPEAEVTEIDGEPNIARQGFLYELGIADLLFKFVGQIFADPQCTKFAFPEQQLSTFTTFHHLAALSYLLLRLMSKENHSVAYKIARSYKNTMVNQLKLLDDLDDVYWDIGKTLRTMFLDNKKLLESVDEKFIVNVVDMIKDAVDLHDIEQYLDFLASFCSHEDHPLTELQDLVRENLIVKNRKLFPLLKVDSQTKQLLVYVSNMSKSIEDIKFIDWERTWIPLATFLKEKEHASYFSACLNVYAEICVDRRAKSQELLRSQDFFPFPILLEILNHPEVPFSVKGDICDLAQHLYVDTSPLSHATDQAQIELNRDWNNLKGDSDEMAFTQTAGFMDARALMEWVFQFLQNPKILSLHAELAHGGYEEQGATTTAGGGGGGGVDAAGGSTAAGAGAGAGAGASSSSSGAAGAGNTSALPSDALSEKKKKKNRRSGVPDASKNLAAKEQLEFERSLNKMSLEVFRLVLSLTRLGFFNPKHYRLRIKSSLLQVLVLSSRSQDERAVTSLTSNNHLDIVLDAKTIICETLRYLLDVMVDHRLTLYLEQFKVELGTLKEDPELGYVNAAAIASPHGKKAFGTMKHNSSALAKAHHEVSNIDADEEDSHAFRWYEASGLTAKEFVELMLDLCRHQLADELRTSALNLLYKSFNVKAYILEKLSDVSIVVNGKLLEVIKQSKNRFEEYNDSGVNENAEAMVHILSNLGHLCYKIDTEGDGHDVSATLADASAMFEADGGAGVSGQPLAQLKQAGAAAPSTHHDAAHDIEETAHAIWERESDHEIADTENQKRLRHADIHSIVIDLLKEYTHDHRVRALQDPKMKMLFTACFQFLARFAHDNEPNQKELFEKDNLHTILSWLPYDVQADHALEMIFENQEDDIDEDLDEDEIGEIVEHFVNNPICRTDRYLILLQVLAVPGEIGVTKNQNIITDELFKMNFPDLFLGYETIEEFLAFIIDAPDTPATLSKREYGIELLRLLTCCGQDFNSKAIGAIQDQIPLTKALPYFSRTFFAGDKSKPFPIGYRSIIINFVREIYFPVAIDEDDDNDADEGRKTLSKGKQNTYRNKKGGRKALTELDTDKSGDGASDHVATLECYPTFLATLNKDFAFIIRTLEHDENITKTVFDKFMFEEVLVFITAFIDDYLDDLPQHMSDLGTDHAPKFEQVERAILQLIQGALDFLHARRELEIKDPRFAISSGDFQTGFETIENILASGFNSVFTGGEPNSDGQKPAVALAQKLNDEYQLYSGNDPNNPAHLKLDSTQRHSTHRSHHGTHGSHGTHGTHGHHGSYKKTTSGGIKGFFQKLSSHGTHHKTAGSGTHHHHKSGGTHHHHHHQSGTQKGGSVSWLTQKLAGGTAGAQSKHLSIIDAAAMAGRAIKKKSLEEFLKDELYSFLQKTREDYKSDFEEDEAEEDDDEAFEEDSEDIDFVEMWELVDILREILGAEVSDDTPTKKQKTFASASASAASAAAASGSGLKNTPSSSTTMAGGTSLLSHEPKYAKLSTVASGDIELVERNKAAILKGGIRRSVEYYHECFSKIFSHLVKISADDDTEDDEEEAEDDEADDDDEALEMQVVMMWLRILTKVASEHEFGKEFSEHQRLLVANRMVALEAPQMICNLICSKHQETLTNSLTLGIHLLEAARVEIADLEDSGESAGLSLIHNEPTINEARTAFYNIFHTSAGGRCLVAIRSHIEEYKHLLKRRRQESPAERKNRDQEEENKHALEIMTVLEFLEKLCRDCSTSMQNFLRSQDDAGTSSESVKLVAEVVSLCHAYRDTIHAKLQKHYIAMEVLRNDAIDDLLKDLQREFDDAEVIKQIYETLSAFIEGPCKGNQDELLANRVTEPILLLLTSLKNGYGEEENENGFHAFLASTQEDLDTWMEVHHVEDDYTQKDITKINPDLILHPEQLHKVRKCDEVVDDMRFLGDDIEANVLLLLLGLFESRGKVESDQDFYDSMCRFLLPDRALPDHLTDTNILFENLTVHWTDANSEEGKREIEQMEEDEEEEEDDIEEEEEEEEELKARAKQLRLEGKLAEAAAVSNSAHKGKHIHRKRHFSTKDVAILYYILLRTCADHAFKQKSRVQRLLYEWQSQHPDLQGHIGRIEIVRNSEIERVYFPIPTPVEHTRSAPIVREVRKAVFRESVLENPQKKIENFMNHSRALVKTIASQDSYRRSILGLFIHERPMQNISYLLAVFINICIIFDLTTRYSMPAIVPRIAGYILLGFAVLLLVAYFLCRFKIDLMKWKDLKKPKLYWFSSSSLLYHICYIGAAVLGLAVNMEWFCFHLFDIILRIRVMRLLVDAVFQNFSRLIGTFFLTFLWIYAFALVGRYAYSDIYSFGPTNCSNLTTVECLRDHLYFGFKDAPEFTDFNDLGGFVFGMLYYIVIILVMASVTTASIIDTFSELRAESDAIDKEKQNCCFICSLTRESLENACEGGFDAHIKNEHNCWQYIYFAIYVEHKHNLQKHLTGPETYWHQRFQRKQAHTCIPILQAAATGIQDNDISNETLARLIRSNQETVNMTFAKQDALLNKILQMLETQQS